MKVPRDEMTPKERIETYKKGERVDRLPVSLSLQDTACSLFGVSIQQYYHDPEITRDIEVQKYNTFGGDNITLGFGRYDMIEALGGDVLFGKDIQKYILTPLIKDYNSINNLKLINPYKDKSHIRTRKAIKLVLEELGDKIFISAKISGPLSIAAELRGTENLLRDLLANRDDVHKLLDFITDCNLEFIKSIANDFGIGMSISDPVSSSSLISPKQFKEFSYPYLKRNCDSIIRYCGKPPSLHICGKTKPIWKDLLNLGISSFSVDNEEDLYELKNTMGDFITIVGNVDPVDVMRFGSYEDVIKESRSCIEKALDSTKGFILSTGCEIPLNTSKENIKGLIDTARLYARNVKMGEGFK